MERVHERRYRGPGRGWLRRQAAIGCRSRAPGAMSLSPRGTSDLGALCPRRIGATSSANTTTAVPAQGRVAHETPPTRPQRSGPRVLTLFKSQWQAARQSGRPYGLAAFCHSMGASSHASVRRFYPSRQSRDSSVSAFRWASGSAGSSAGGMHFFIRSTYPFRSSLAPAAARRPCSCSEPSASCSSTGSFLRMCC